MRGILEKFTRNTGFTVSLLDYPGMNTLITSGRRDICSEFHRASPASAEICLKSDQQILALLDGQGGTFIETCGHGLTYSAAPVIVKGRQIASLVAGRLLLREPDLERFKKQAALYGFDEGDYLKALKEVPVAPEESIRGMTACLGELVSLVLELEYDRLEPEGRSGRPGGEAGDPAAGAGLLRESAADYRVLFENAGAAIVIADAETGTILDANKQAEWLTGRTRSELVGMARAKLHPPDQLERYNRYFVTHMSAGRAMLPDAFVDRKDGTRVPVQISATVLEIGGRKVVQGLFDDISVRKRIENDLKISEQKYRDLAEAIPDLVWETDETGAGVYVSPKLKELLGYEAGEVTGKNLFEFIATGVDEESAEDFEPYLQQKKPFRNIEHVCRHKDGRRRVLESSGNPFFDEAGRYRGYKGLTRDITDRKRLEDEHAMKATLLDSVKDAVFLHDLGGRIVYANEAAYLQFGYAEDSMSNMMFQRLLTPESAKKFDEQTRYAVNHGKAVFESEHLRTDGGVMPVETQAHALELYGEKFVLRVVRDVTERKQAERALKESEERFRVTFENAPIGMCLTDTKGQVLAANSTLCSLSGYSPEEILLHNSAEFTHPDDIALTAEWMRGLAAGEAAAHSIEKRYIGKGGRVISTEVSASILRHAQGTPLGVIIAMQDITERKEAEHAQRQLMKELEKINAEISQFNSLIAHDLQEPMRMVRSYSQLLEKRLAGKLDAAGEEFLAYIMNGGRLMQKMLEDLMLYLHEGANPEMLREVDMNEVLDQVLLLLSSSIEENRAVVSRGRLPVVVADRTQMTHLLQNLVGNALKFKGADVPRISVSCDAAESGDVFTVRDTGIGIAPQFLERIFKIFQRLHTREEYPGTGVGLALCRKIVENHGGRIWVESDPGKGAVFHFSIPRRGAVPAACGQEQK